MLETDIVTQEVKTLLSLQNAPAKQVILCLLYLPRKMVLLELFKFKIST